MEATQEAANGSPFGQHVVHQADVHKCVDFNVLAVKDALVVRSCPLANRCAHVDVVEATFWHFAAPVAHFPHVVNLRGGKLVSAPEPQKLKDAKALLVRPLDGLVEHGVHLIREGGRAGRKEEVREEEH